MRHKIIEVSMSAERLYLNEEWLKTQLLLHGNATEVARANDMAERTVQRYANRLSRNLVPDTIRSMPHPVPLTPLMDEIRIRGNGLVSSDWHIPLTSHELIAQAIESAIAHGCTDYCAIVGDYFNFDALSSYYPKQDNAGLETELVHGGQLIELLLQVFDYVYVTKGNHDVRMLNALGFKLKFERSIRMCLPSISDEQMERIIVTGLDYIVVDSDREKPWHCCHTNAYAKSMLTIPNEIALIHDVNVAAGHRHHHAIGRARNGNYVVELGGLFDEAKTQYLRQWTNTFPKWAPGWMLLYDGLPYLPFLAPSPTRV